MAALLNARALAFAAAAWCLAALLVAYFFMERHLLLPPCPLCILDRFAVGLAGFGFLWVGVFWKRVGVARCGWWLSTAALAAGFVFAIRHIWLQNRPVDETAACLSDNATAATLVEIVAQAFDATADCGAIMWEFAGLSIPEQVLLLLVALAFLQIVVAVGVWRKR